MKDDTSARGWPSRVRQLARISLSSLADVRYGWFDALVFDLLFRALALVVIGPLAAWLLAQFIRASGNEAIGNFDLLIFIGQPTTGILLVLLIGANVGLSSLRFAGLQAILCSARSPNQVDYREALLMVIGRLRSILVLAVITVALSVLSMAPFAALLYLIARWLLAHHDINYYLEAQPPEWWLAVALGAAVALTGGVLLFRLLLPLLITFPSVVLKNRRPVPAWWHARQQLRGNQGRALVLIAGWILFWLLVWALFSVGLYGLGSLLVPPVEDRLTGLIMVLGGLTLLSATASYLTLWIATCTACSLCIRFYIDVTEGQSEPWQIGIVAPSLPPNRLIRHRRWTIPLLLAAMVVISLSWTMSTMQTIRVRDQVEITAHRGASSVAPENTLAAIEEAIRAGATIVELDVQRTADGVLVLHHDADLMRIASVNQIVSESSYEELRQHDVSGRFDESHPDARLATLDQAVEVARGRVRLMLELKSYRDDSERLVDELLDHIRRHRLTDEVLVISLKYSELLMVEARQPELLTGFVATTSLGDLTRLGVDILAVPRGRATDVLITSAHARGKEVHVWTIDDPTEMHRMIDLGVDNIITNDPATLVRVLREREGLTNAERLLLRFRELYRWK